MAFVPPPPPNAYMYVEDMSREQLENKLHALIQDILRLYVRVHNIEDAEEKQRTPIPEKYLDRPVAKPFPEVITPNVIMRSFAVDGTVEREYYNAKRQIGECERIILNIEARL